MTHLAKQQNHASDQQESSCIRRPIRRGISVVCLTTASENIRATDQQESSCINCQQTTSSTVIRSRAHVRESAPRLRLKEPLRKIGLFCLCTGLTFGLILTKRQHVSEKKQDHHHCKDFLNDLVFLKCFYSKYCGHTCKFKTGVRSASL